MQIYCQMSFGQFHARNSEIIRISAKLNRTPSSLAMKLCNLASLDPAHQARGVAGLKSVSRSDRDIWEEFTRDWTGMAAASAVEMERLLGYMGKQDADAWIVPKRATAGTAQVQIRKGQGFFRTAVLTAYGNRCCLTECAVSEFLVASHIVPWSSDESNRLNPRNGLCLAPMQDRAFDLGFIAFSDELRVVVSGALLKYESDPLVKSQLLSLAGAPMRLPERFYPDLDLISRHRREVFGMRN